jgi:hypothetical protein
MRIVPLPSAPRKVLLFTGHMIDAPGRAVARFPASCEPRVALAIGTLLDELCAGPQDLAISSAACGGDILFAEAVLARGVPLQVCLPFEPPAFAAMSVAHGGPGWRSRFDEVCTAAHLRCLGADPAAGAAPFEQANQWMLDAALAHGAQCLDFIGLWDGRPGDGPGGTQHLVQQVAQQQGRVHRLDPTLLCDGLVG